MWKTTPHSAPKAAPHPVMLFYQLGKLAVEQKHLLVEPAIHSPGNHILPIAIQHRPLKCPSTMVAVLVTFRQAQEAANLHQQLIRHCVQLSPMHQKFICLVLPLGDPKA